MKHFLALSCLALAACSPPPPAPKAKQEPAPVYFQVDPATAGSISGTVSFHGKKPARTPVSMDADADCVAAHKTPVYDEPVVADSKGHLANTFVYVKQGLEGKTFPPPSTPVVIDQKGCWFNPRVLGVQTAQAFNVTNSDPVTHNIHPMAHENREWNQSQAQGAPPLSRKFARPEIMIPVKCNIHAWMHAFIGVTAHPYFAVTGADGSFTLPNLPPGDYVIAAWHETLGTRQINITVGPSAKQVADFTFRSEN